MGLQMLAHLGSLLLPRPKPETATLVAWGPMLFSRGEALGGLLGLEVTGSLV